MFRRPTIRYSQTPEPVTPYQRAAQVWDDRIGAPRVQAFCAVPDGLRWRGIPGLGGIVQE